MRPSVVWDLTCSSGLRVIAALRLAITTGQLASVGRCMRASVLLVSTQAIVEILPPLASRMLLHSGFVALFDAPHALLTAMIGICLA